MTSGSLIADCMQALETGESTRVVRAWDPDHSHINELLMFLKPECFLSGSRDQRRLLLGKVFERIDDFRSVVGGITVLSGEFLSKTESIDRHYGFINAMSKNASQMLSATDIPSTVCPDTGIPIIGGHEALERFGHLTAQSLDELWRTKQSLKLRSGLYVQSHGIRGDEYVIVNGFHPWQLEHYTAPGRNILVMVIRSNESWSALRELLAGDTFPEKADENSLRGYFHRERERLTDWVMSAVQVNALHLSAGPFEAAFELNNFLASVSGFGFSLHQTRIASILRESGTENEIEPALRNPTVRCRGKVMDLFAATELMNTPDAVQILLDLGR